MKFAKLVIAAVTVITSCNKNCYNDEYIMYQHHAISEINKTILLSDSNVISYYDSSKVKDVLLFQSSLLWKIHYYENGNLQYMYKTDAIDTFHSFIMFGKDTSYTDSVVFHDVGFYFYENGMLRTIRKAINDSCFYAEYFSEKGEVKEESYCRMHK